MKHLTDKQIETLEKLLDEHDCHRSADDGCLCLEVKERLYGQPYPDIKTDEPF